MLLRAYSDFHGFLPRVEPCDALLIAGDICPIDGEYGDHEPKTQARWIKEVFNPWCEAMPVEQIVLIAGNHDAILDPIHGRGFHYELGEKVTYLLDESVQIEGGPLIFGSPWIPNLARWPFYRPGYRLRELAQEMPANHDVWMLHAPPAAFESGYKLDWGSGSDGHVGNPYVTPVIEGRGPQLVICGHVHQGFGVAAIGNSNIANVAFVDERYRVKHRHFEIEWDEAERSITRVEAIHEAPERGLWWSCRDW